MRSIRPPYHPVAGSAYLDAHQPAWSDGGVDAEAIKRLLDLAPLTFEGGYFRETYRSGIEIRAEALPGRYQGARSAGTAIYYLLDPSTFSGLHRLKSDETYHFYRGDPVEMLVLFSAADGAPRGERVILGSDLEAGHQPQYTVPAGVWQGSRLLGDGEFALMGTTMAPGFARADFEGAPRPEELSAQYPEFSDLIVALTRSKLA